VTKENSLDGHIHRHIHELVGRGGLRQNNTSSRLKIFLEFLLALLLGAVFVGALWFQWLK
jgi:hypothetical protein